MRNKRLLATLLLSVSTLSASASEINVAGGSDDPYMMPYYTGNILPAPQKAVYSERYLSLKTTGIILGKEIEKTDGRLKYLLERIKRYGGSYQFIDKTDDSKSCLIYIGDTTESKTLTPPDKAQGYQIKSMGKRVFLKPHDHQGLLWAISSLNQMILIRGEETLLRVFDATDWPQVLTRGFFASRSFNDPEKILHFMVAFKFNMIDFRSAFSLDRKHHIDWRLKKSDIFHERVRRTGKAFRSLGFTWYAGSRFLGHGDTPQLNCSDETDFNIIYENFAKPIAAAGGSLSVQFDDIRFPLHSEDKKRFGSAAKADSFFINKLYNKLKQDYPNIRIVFCPPFYFGPDSRAIYPESRDEYLQTIGENFPEAVDIYWTGPRVKGAKTTPEHVKWFAEKIKRKPFIFQNGTGIPHVHGYHYTTDPVHNLKDWYYEGYLNDIGSYVLNGGGTPNSGVLVSLSDWFWNPKSFEPEKVIKDGVMKLVGPEAWPILKKINTQLTVFDPYYGTVTPGAVLQAKTLLATADDLARSLAKINQINGKSVDFWTAVQSHNILIIQRFVKRLRKAGDSPALKDFAKRVEDTKKHATTEAKYDPAHDVFLSACEFTGGKGPAFYQMKKGNINIEKRLCSYIYGAKSAFPKMSGKFEVAPFPPSGDYLLILSAVDDDVKEKCPIKITVNGKTIFDGPNPFDNRNWNTKTLTIPANILERYNTITVHNTNPASNYGSPPFFMLNYAILRKTEK